MFTAQFVKIKRKEYFSENKTKKKNTLRKKESSKTNKFYLDFKLKKKLFSFKKKLKKIIIFTEFSLTESTSLISSFTFYVAAEDGSFSTRNNLTVVKIKYFS